MFKILCESNGRFGSRVAYLKSEEVEVVFATREEAEARVAALYAKLSLYASVTYTVVSA